jgi:hypothetical protein
MSQCITDLTPPIFLQNPDNDWWNNEKTGDWAENVFREFSLRTKQPMVMRKGNFHELIYLMNQEEVDPEITEKLNAIYDLIKPQF